MNIRAFLEQQVEKSLEKTYLYFQDQEVTYGELDRRANRVANGMLGLGIRKGDRISVFLTNSPEFLYIWFGLNKIGLIMVPINLSLKEREIAYIVNHSDAKAIFAQSIHYSLLERVKRECPSLQKIITIGNTIPGAIHFESWLPAQRERLDPVEIDEEDEAVYVYTSGTTGTPKGVMLTHQSYVLTGQSYAHLVGIESNDRIMTANPLFHINAQAYSVMGSMAGGASLVLIERFSASKLWEQAKQYQATKIVLLLALTHILWNRPESEKDRDHTVRKVIAGGAPRGHFRDFERRFGVQLQTIYSLTESPLAIMSPKGSTPKDGGIGIPMLHPDNTLKNEVRIVNQEGDEVSPYTVGEMVIRNRAIMKGYFKDKGLSSETIRGGWLHTGDSGYRDEEGYFFFVGRMKEIIRRKGENISALEVEAAINRHPKVLESAVIGIPSPSGLGDEEAKAFVVLKNGETLAYPELIEFLSKELASFKVPRYLEYRPDLPMNAMGRVTKEVLKQEKPDLTKDCFDREMKA